MKRHPLTLVALCSLIAILLSSCQAPSKSTGFPADIEPPKKAEGAEAEGPVELTGPIEVIDSLFKPEQATVKVGTTVKWEQTGSAPHTVTSEGGKRMNSHPECVATEPAKCMGAGDTYEFTFTEPGEYIYYCVIHGTPAEPDGSLMNGKIIVE